MTSLRRARRRDARLVPVVAAAWLTAGLSTAGPDAAAPAALALWIATLVAVCAAARMPARYRTGCAVLAVMLAVAAAVCTQVAAAEPARTAARGLPIDGGRSLRIDVTAVGKIEPSDAGWRFDATLHTAWIGEGADGTAFGGGVPVLVRLTERPEGLDLGARLRVTGTAWRTQAGQRPVLVVDATGAPELLHPADGVLGVAAALRTGLARLTSGLPPPGAGLIAGIAVGDTSAVSAELDRAMKASSLSHLTAVSGANCALVVAVAFGVAAACRARRGVRVAAGLVALAGFVVLVSPEASVVRAATMAAIAMIGVLLGRLGAGLSLLSAAVIVLLIADPWLGQSLGFALSAAATGALLILAGPLADGLARWMPMPLALGLSVPLSAQLVCGPLIVLIAPQVATYGVIANVLAAPAAPVGTLLGLAACLSAGIPLLGSGLAAVAWVPSAWIGATATTLTALPGAVVPWPDGPLGLGALAVVGAAVTAVIVPAPPRLRRAGVLVVAVACAAGLIVGAGGALLARSRIPTGWSIAACDVGQGDAVLVRSQGAIMLIDTGPEADLLARCLEVLDIDHIDVLVLTHFDLDHRGGVDAVVGRTDLVLHGPPAGEEDDRLLGGLAADGATVRTVVRGMSGQLGGARWRVLWPNTAAAAGNDAGVVVEVTGGAVPVSLFLADLSAAGQQAMRAGAVLRSTYDVIKTAHHGSADQDPRLYARLHPTVALLTVGDNDYGHPRVETLTMLADLGARVARTDREGMLLVWREEGGVRLWSERPADAVAPGG